MNSVSPVPAASTAAAIIRPKVIQVVESFAYGTAKSVQQLSDFLKADFDVEVFYCDRDGTEEELKGVDPDVKWTPLTGTGPLKHLKNIRTIRAQIDGQCQAVHGHSSYGGLYARLAACGKSVPHVFFSPRGYAFLRQDMHSAKRSLFLLAEFVLSFLGTTIACGPSEHKVGGRFSRQIMTINNSVVMQNTADTTIVDQSAVNQSAVEQSAIEQSAVEQSAVEQSAVDRSAGELPGAARFRVLSIGRIAPQKGFDLLLSVADRLPAIEFTWVGSCEDDYYEQMLTARGGLPGNVKLIAYMPQAQLFATLREHAVIMHPSRWEGLSRVLLEALAMAKPIVTSTYAANLDCLQPVAGGGYANGFACATLEDYCKAILQLKDDEEMLADMAQASRQLAENSFDVRVIRQQWLDLYHGRGTNGEPT